MKSLIRNKLGDKAYGFSVPAPASDLSGFLNLLEGTYEVYEKKSETGSDDVSSAFRVRLQIRNSSTDARDYLTMYVDITKNENDVKNALVGKNVNGIDVDEVVIIEWKRVNFGSSNP